IGKQLVSLLAVIGPQPVSPLPNRNSRNGTIAELISSCDEETLLFQGIQSLGHLYLGQVLSYGLVEPGLAAPIADVKRRIGNDEVGFEIFVGVVQKRAFVIPSDPRSIDTTVEIFDIQLQQDEIVTIERIAGKCLSKPHEQAVRDAKSSPTTCRMPE